MTAPQSIAAEAQLELNDILSNPALMGAASALGAALANFENELDKAKRAKGIPGRRERLNQTHQAVRGKLR